MSRRSLSSYPMPGQVSLLELEPPLITPGEAGVDLPIVPSNPDFDMNARGIALRSSLGNFNARQKGLGVASDCIPGDVQYRINVTHEHGIAGVQARFEIHDKKSREQLAKACGHCALASECHLGRMSQSARFGEFYSDRNLAKSPARDKFIRRLSKNPNLKCDDTLTEIKTKKKET